MKKNIKISAIVITYNEGNNIRSCLESLKWADEIIIIDSGSTDSTIKIAKKYTKKIFQVKFNNDFALLRNFALKKAIYDWVITLDADETLPKNSNTIIHKLILNTKKLGFWFPRRQYIDKYHYLKYGYFYPDYQLRLFMHKNYKYINPVHEQINIPKNKTKIVNSLEIYHNSSKSKYNSFTSFFRLIPYIKIEAFSLSQKNKKNISMFNGIQEIIKHIYRSYIKLHGYKDGYIGFRAAFIHAIYKGFIIFQALIYEKKLFKRIFILLI